VKILYLTWLDPATTDYPLFLAQQWETMGHNVRLFPYDLEFSNRATERLDISLAWERPSLRSLLLKRQLDRVCQHLKPDVLLSGGFFLLPEDMHRLQKRHHFKLGYIIGYNHLMEGATVTALQAANFLIVHDSYLIPILRGTRYGKIPHVFFMPCMADPLEHHPLPLNGQDQQAYGGDIAFVGGHSENRISALRQLTRYDLRIWGPSSWKQFADLAPFHRSEPVYGLKKTKIYNAAKIVLNIEDNEKQINAISNRIPEVLACGGFVISDWRQDLADSPLQEGKSIVTFRTFPELEEKVAYYLSHPEERKRVSEEGRRIVLGSMTYAHIAPVLASQIADVVRGD